MWPGMGCRSDFSVAGQGAGTDRLPQNVQVSSGAAIRDYGWRERIAEKLTEGGVLTQDLDLLRVTAREMLVGVLSCRDNMSRSGMGARYAGTMIGADGYLPNMATTEFLSCLSRQAMERTASAEGVAPRRTGKETRAAMIAQVGQGRFIHPAALFPPTAAELQARRHPKRLIETGYGDKDADPQADPDEPGAEGEVEHSDDMPGHDECSPPPDLDGGVAHHPST